MITINGHKFAKNDKGFIESLFDKSGTCCGYYKKLKNRVHFMDMRGEIFAALVCNGDFDGFVNARKTDKGVFYQHGISDKSAQFFGIPAGYSESIEYAKEIFKAI